MKSRFRKNFPEFGVISRPILSTVDQNFTQLRINEGKLYERTIGHQVQHDSRENSGFSIHSV